MWPDAPSSEVLAPPYFNVARRSAVESSSFVVLVVLALAWAAIPKLLDLVGVQNAHSPPPVLGERDRGWPDETVLDWDDCNSCTLIDMFYIYGR